MAVQRPAVFAPVAAPAAAASDRASCSTPRYHRCVQTSFTVTCPYCFEEVEIYLEPDVRGALVQDCEVCCNPWQLRVTREGNERYVEVAKADGSE